MNEIIVDDITYGLEVSNGFCFEKDLEVDANYHSLLGWNILRRRSTFAKIWLCQYVNWDYLP
jgi:hypothetical protein